MIIINKRGSGLSGVAGTCPHSRRWFGCCRQTCSSISPSHGSSSMFLLAFNTDFSTCRSCSKDTCCVQACSTSQYRYHCCYSPWVTHEDVYKGGSWGQIACFSPSVAWARCFPQLVIDTCAGFTRGRRTWLQYWGLSLGCNRCLGCGDRIRSLWWLCANKNEYKAKKVNNFNDICWHWKIERMVTIILHLN